jgi:hypothetical protein
MYKMDYKDEVIAIITVKRLQDIHLSQKLEARDKEALITLSQKIQSIMSKDDNYNSKIVELNKLSRVYNYDYENTENYEKSHQEIVTLMFTKMINSCSSCSDALERLTLMKQIHQDTNDWFLKEFQTRSQKHSEFKKEYKRIIKSVINDLWDIETERVRHEEFLARQLQIRNNDQLRDQFKEYYFNQYVLCKLTIKNGMVRNRTYTNDGLTFYVKAKELYKEIELPKGGIITEKFRLHLTFTNTIYKFFYSDISNLIISYYSETNIPNNIGDVEKRFQYTLFQNIPDFIKKVEKDGIDKALEL